MTPLVVHCKRRHGCDVGREIRLRQYTADAQEERVSPDANTSTYAEEHWLTREPEDPGPCHMCQAALRRRDAARRGEVLPFYIVATATSRHYGGPEEGGWWYDALNILAVRRVFTFKGAREAIRELREEHPTCKYGRGSVLGGDDVEVHVFYDESFFPFETRERPRYE